MAPPPGQQAGAPLARGRRARLARASPASPLAAWPLAALAPLALPAACRALCAPRRPGGLTVRRGSLPAAGGGFHQQRRIHGKRVAAGAGAGVASGMMLFDLEEKAQKDFTRDTIMSWLPREPRTIRCLEWFPDFDRANIKTILQSVAVFGCGEVTPPYYVAACDLPADFQDNFGKASFADWILVKVVKWRPGVSTTLDGVPDDHLDIVLCDHGAVKRIGDEAFAAAVSETHRMLKPGGDFMLFMDDNGVPPPNAEDLFSLEEELGGGEFSGGLNAYRLQPLMQQAVPARRKRRRRRKLDEPGALPEAPADDEA